jgi:hypothetical protein
MSQGMSSRGFEDDRSVYGGGTEGVVVANVGVDEVMGFGID